MYRDSAYLSINNDATNVYFAQISTASQSDTPQLHPNSRNDTAPTDDIKTTALSENSEQTSLGQEISKRVSRKYCELQLSPHTVHVYYM